MAAPCQFKEWRSNTGSTGDDNLLGFGGDDLIDGGKGADTMDGGTGDDTFIVDNINDHILEASNDGNDTVVTSVLIANTTNFANVENFTFKGKGNWSFVGDGEANIITAGSGNDTLDGGAGADTLNGGAGNDTYYLDNPNDKVVDSGGKNDTVFSTALITQAMTGIESYGYTGNSNWTFTGDDLSNSLTGGSGADHLLGGKGNDTLNSGAGADTLEGGVGNDIYELDNAGDIVVEAGDKTGGTDLAKVSTDLNLTTNPGLQGAFIENITLLNGATTVFGNDLGNIILGNDNGNTISSGKSNDTITGGSGADTLNGNEGNDKLTGGEGANTLNGGADNDVLTGGTGTDTSALNGTGNAAANVLTGNAGDNILDGGKGIDTFHGGAGNDTYMIDVADELGNITDSAGSDTINTGLQLTAGDIVSGIENYTYAGSKAWGFSVAGVIGVSHTLSGGSGTDQLTGADKDDVLDGGKGIDILSGGTGNDTYLVDNTKDTVNELGGQGTHDLVKASVSYTLSSTAEVEDLTLTGKSAINGTGDALDNIVIGNDGKNVLIGGNGQDALTGGLGADTFKYKGPPKAAPARPSSISLSARAGISWIFMICCSAWALPPRPLLAAASWTSPMTVPAIR